MKKIDWNLVLTILGMLIFICGIVFNNGWFFVIGLGWLGLAYVLDNVMSKYQPELFNYESDDSDSDSDSDSDN